MKPRKKIIINDQLYHMLAKLFDLYNTKEDISLKNKSEKFRRMGKWIYLSWKMYSKANNYYRYRIEANDTYLYRQG